MLALYLLNSCIVLGLAWQQPFQETRQPKAANEILSSLQTSQDLSVEEQDNNNLCEESKTTFPVGDEHLNKQVNIGNNDLFGIQDFQSALSAELSNKEGKGSPENMAAVQNLLLEMAQPGFILNSQENTNPKTGKEKEQFLNSLILGLLTNAIVIPKEMPDLVKESKKLNKIACVFDNTSQSTIRLFSTRKSAIIPQNIDETLVEQNTTDVTLLPHNARTSSIKPVNTTLFNIEPHNASLSTTKPVNTTLFNIEPHNASLSTTKPVNTTRLYIEPYIRRLDTTKPINTIRSNIVPDNASGFKNDTVSERGFNIDLENASGLHTDPDNASIFIINSANASRVSIDPDSTPGLSHLPTTNPKASTTETSSLQDGIILAGLHIPFCQLDHYCSSMCQLASRSNEPSSNSSNLTLSPQKRSTYDVSSPLTNGPPKPILCNCDSKCIIYGDCCADVFQNCWNITSTKQVQTLLVQTRFQHALTTQQAVNVSHDRLVNNIRQHSENAEHILDYMYMRFASCELKDIKGEKMKLFISQCPVGVTPKSREKCENNPEIALPPVTAVFGRFHMTFLNEFCAKCHGLTKHEFSSWITGLVCSSELIDALYEHIFMTDIRIFARLGFCNISYVDPTEASQQRICFTSEKQTAAHHLKLLDSVAKKVCTQTDMMLCESYYFNMDFYRNPHCQLCLGSVRRTPTLINTQNTMTQTMNLSVTCKKDVDISDRSPVAEGIFIIFNVDRKSSDMSRSKSSKSVNILPVCDETEAFDPIFKKCTSLACPIVAVSNDTSCFSSKRGTLQPTESSLQDNWIQLNLQLQTPENHFSCRTFTSGFLEAVLPNCVASNDLLNDYQPLSTNNATHKSPVNDDKITWCSENYPPHEKEDSTSVELNLTVAMKLDLNCWNRLKIFSQNLSLDTYQMIIVGLSSSNSSSSMCTSSDFHASFDSFSVEEILGTLHVVINSTKRTLYYPLGSVGYRLQVNNDNNLSHVLESIGVCEVSKLFFRADCDVIDYAMNETTLGLKDQFIAQYGGDNVDIHEDRVYICVQFNAIGDDDTVNSDTTFLILTWTLTGLSVLCLFVMLTIYCLFPELCTLPGKMTAGLAATMLLTFLLNSLGMVKFHHQYVCPVVAAVNHVIVLAQFGWMSAIAVNMALTFGPNSLVRVKSLHSKKPFIRYNIVVWSLSIVIVTSSVVLDLIHNDQSIDGDRFQCNDTASAMSSGEDTFHSCSVHASSVEFPQYGNEICTWFTAPVWAKLAFVVVPFSLSYVVNVVCFVITVVGIIQSNRRAKKLGKKFSNYIQCIIFIKMSTVMGFSWILGLPWGFEEGNMVLIYIRASLILLQGVFLFLAFMANKRVIRILKGRIARWEMSTRTLSSSSVKKEVLTGAGDGKK